MIGPLTVLFLQPILFFPKLTSGKFAFGVHFNAKYKAKVAQNSGTPTKQALTLP
jgi:hypothetical protein